ncbi:MAG TPA: hypothetical protein VNM43_11830 [Dehalococcoidia bacterium]|nr:hypothetical protein [Dehalococcoidia bacterium]
MERLADHLRRLADRERQVDPGLRYRQLVESVFGRISGVSAYGEYETLDWEEVELQGQSVVLEVIVDYSGRWRGEITQLTEGWIGEFESSMMRFGNEYALVVTERSLPAALKNLRAVSERVFEYIAAIDILFVETSPWSGNEIVLSRLSRALEQLAKRITRSRSPA